MGYIKRIRIDEDPYDIVDAKNIATVEAGSTASKAYATGDYFIYDGMLCVVTEAIAQGDTLSIGTNIETTTVTDEMGKGLVGTHVYYGRCATVAADNTKIVDCPDFSEEDVKPGDIIYIYFNSRVKTDETVYLQINDTTPTKVQDEFPSEFPLWHAGDIVGFIKITNAWRILNRPAASSTQYGMTMLTSSVSSNSYNIAASASAVKTAYNLAESKQDALVSGTNIKTINNTSLLGAGNLLLQSPLTAGYGIDITNNEISATAKSVHYGCIIDVSGNYEPTDLIRTGWSFNSPISIADTKTYLLSESMVSVTRNIVLDYTSNGRTFDSMRVLYYVDTFSPTNTSLSIDYICGDDSTRVYDSFSGGWYTDVYRDIIITGIDDSAPTDVRRWLQHVATSITCIDTQPPYQPVISVSCDTLDSSTLAPGDVLILYVGNYAMLPLDPTRDVGTIKLEIDNIEYSVFCDNSAAITPIMTYYWQHSATLTLIYNGDVWTLSGAPTSVVGKIYSELSSKTKSIMKVKSVTSDSLTLNYNQSGAFSFPTGAFEEDGYTLAGVVGYNVPNSSHVTIARIYPTNSGEIAAFGKNANFAGGSGTSVTVTLTVYALYVKDGLVNIDI